MWRNMEESLLSTAAEQQLDRFCRQYYQIQLNLDYPDGEYLRQYEFQQAIYSRLFAHRAVEYEAPARFRLRVLKELIRLIESSIQDWEEEAISDDLMWCLSSLISSNIPSEAMAAQQKSYVTYTLASVHHTSSPPPPSVPKITLLEARNLVAAAGTTGLRTWEAALHFGNYLARNPQIIQEKSVLELGAGTGYLSVLCAKHLRASHVLSTDGSDDVVAHLPTNFYLHGLQDSSLIEAKELKWGHALIGSEQLEWNQGRNIDVVIGADVTYDSRTIMLLVGTFGDLFELYPGVKIFIAATVRNPETFQQFLKTCKMNRYHVEEIEDKIPSPEEQEGPFYSADVPIRLSLITKSQ